MKLLVTLALILTNIFANISDGYSQEYPQKFRCRSVSTCNSQANSVISNAPKQIVETIPYGTRTRNYTYELKRTDRRIDNSNRTVLDKTTRKLNRDYKRDNAVSSTAKKVSRSRKSSVSKALRPSSTTKRRFSRSR